MLALEDSEHLARTPNNYRYLITLENAISLLLYLLNFGLSPTGGPRQLINYPDIQLKLLGTIKIKSFCQYQERHSSTLSLFFREITKKGGRSRCLHSFLKEGLRIFLYFVC